MSAIPLTSDYRVFGIDIGVDNMGMASVLMTGDRRTVIEKLDWRPLIPKGVPPTAESIVAYTAFYIDQITSPTLGAPPAADGGAPGPISPPPAHLVPQKVVIEQQYTAMSDGINVHALEIQIALMARFAERYPTTYVQVVGASARKSKKLRAVDPKARAMVVGRTFVGLDSPYWTTYLNSLDDMQHTCDALTMILDDLRFANLPTVKALVQEWETKQQSLPSVPRKAAAAAPSEPAPIDGSFQEVTDPSAVVIPLPATECTSGRARRGGRGRYRHK